MKHKSRFLLPILTFLTFGMVVGSVVSTGLNNNLKSASAEDRTVYFRRPTSWSDWYTVRLHAWNNSESTGYPDMSFISTQGNYNTYSYAGLDTKYTTMLLQNIDASGQYKGEINPIIIDTGGANMYDGELSTWIYWDGTTDISGTRTIYFYDTSDWNSAYIYCWNHNANNGSLQQMTEIGTYNNHKIYCKDVYAYYENFIFGKSSNWDDTHTGDNYLTQASKTTLFYYQSGQTNTWKQYVEYYSNDENANTYRTYLDSGDDLIAYDAGCGWTAPLLRHFIKWNTESSGSGIDYQPGDAYSSGSVRLYAIWDFYPMTYSVGGSAYSSMDTNGENPHGVYNCLKNYFIELSSIKKGDIFSIKVNGSLVDSSDIVLMNGTYCTTDYHCNNFEKDDSGNLRFKYNVRKGGYIDIVAFNSSGSVKYAAYGGGIATSAGAGLNCGLVINDTDIIMGSWDTDKWTISDVFLEEGDKIKFYNSSAELNWADPSVDGSNPFNPHFNDSSLTYFDVTADGAAPTVVKSGQNGYYDVYVENTNESKPWVIKGSIDGFVVTFNSNGHGVNFIEYSPYNSGTGKPISRPDDPTAPGCTFEGWYTEEECDTPFDFSSNITADTDLYAKWTENIRCNVDISDGLSLMITVTGSYIGNEVKTIKTSAPDPNNYNNDDRIEWDDYYDIEPNTDYMIGRAITVNSAELTDLITIEFFKSKYSTSQPIPEKTLNFTLADILNDKVNQNIDSTTTNLCASILTYASASQVLCGHNMEDMAINRLENKEIRTNILETVSNKTLTDEPEGYIDNDDGLFDLNKIGNATGNNFKLTYRFYFECEDEDVDKYEFHWAKKSGEITSIYWDGEMHTEWVSKTQKRRYFELGGFKPYDMHSYFTITITYHGETDKNFEEQYSMYRYNYNVTNNPSYSSYAFLAKSMEVYYDCAVAYRTAHPTV